MIAFLNGRYVPETEAFVPITDRGFLYGDGVFETLRVSRGCPLWWSLHMGRLQRGAEVLRITLPLSVEELRHTAIELIRRNAMPEAILRITISRGIGTRGYSTKGASQPTLALTLHPLSAPPASICLATATIRVPAHDPLSAVKSANKLAQILARAEAEERGADEALLLNVEGDVAEASSSNIFWIERGEVCTPPVSDGALPGVIRAVIINLCQSHNIVAAERSVARAALLRAEAVFLTNSTAGILPVAEIDAQKLNSSPLIGTLQGWLSEAETAEAMSVQSEG
jgi:branched-chain amino acid aminotransferase